MKIILLENLKKIGSIGEVIDVKRGFARNYLIANKKALHASKENILKVDKIKSELSKKDNEKKLVAKQISEKICLSLIVSSRKLVVLQQPPSCFDNHIFFSQFGHINIIFNLTNSYWAVDIRMYQS